MRIWTPIQQAYRQQKTRRKDKSHLYFRCGNCKATLRVPKGMGTLEVTCPKCKQTTTKKT